MTNSNRQLYLGNLSFDATTTMVRDAFRRLGIKISDVRIVIDKDTNRPRGFAFVDLAPDETSSPAAVVEMVDGLVIDGREVRVSEARPRPSKKTGGGKSGSERRPNENSRAKARGRRGRNSEFGGTWNEDD